MKHLRIEDGQDELLRLHSAAVARPKRITAAPSPVHRMCAAMGCAFWSAEDSRVATAAPTPVALEPVQVEIESETSTEEVWHEGPPPVPGVYEAYHAPARPTRGFCAWWDGHYWHANKWMGGYDNPIQEARADPFSCMAVQWLRLVEADEPAKVPSPSADS
jgi:hypothetical protein